MKSKKRVLERDVWVGFVDGKPHVSIVNDAGGYGEHTRIAVFSSRREAKKQYQDVRKMSLVH